MDSLQIADASPPGVDKSAPAEGVVSNRSGVGSVQLSTDQPLTKPKQDGDRPAWLPEKFKSPEDMAKAYGELEKKIGAPKGDTKPAADSPPAEIDAKIGGKEAKTSTLTQLAQEFAESGDLSDSSKARLARAGLTQADFQVYVEGQKAVAAQQARDLADAVGGEETFRSVLGWAKGNLSDAEIALYDSAISEANIPLAKMLLTAIHSRFVAENGAEGRMVEGKRAPTNAGARGFESTEQAVAFVRDPRYQSDPAYRSEFMERVKASKPGILG